MKFFLGIIFLSLFLNISNLHAKSRLELHNDGVKALQEGGKIIFLRHAYAPRTVENGDNDKNYKEKRCSTQRDILSEGIKQSKEIGKFILENNINIEKVISSPTCRTYKTAKYADWEYTINKDLRNTSKKKLQKKASFFFIIFLRHAYAPRTVENGDNDKNYKEKRCSTQRDILSEGIKQSKEIGKFILENNINIEKVISSPTCRTYKTAKYADWEYTINKDLRNTSKKKLQKKRFKKINDIVSKWKGKGNLVLVTHFMIINPTFPGVKADSGEMIIVNSDMAVLGRIRFPYDITIKD